MDLKEKYLAMRRKYENSEQLLKSTLSDYRDMFSFEPDNSVYDIEVKPVTEQMVLAPDFFKAGSDRMLYFDNDIWFMDYNIAKNISEDKYYNFSKTKAKLISYIQNGGVCLLIQKDSAEQLYFSMKRQDFKEHTCTLDEILKIELSLDSNTVIFCNGIRFEYSPVNDRWNSDDNTVHGDYFIGKKISVLRTSADLNNCTFDGFYFQFLTESHYIPNDEEDANGIIAIIEEAFSAFNMLRNSKKFYYVFPCPTLMVNGVEYQPDSIFKDKIVNPETKSHESISTILGTIVKLSLSKTLVDFLVAKKEDELSGYIGNKPVAKKLWYKKMQTTPVKDIEQYDTDFSKKVMQRRSFYAMKSARTSNSFQSIVDSSKEFSDPMKFDHLLRPLTGKWWNSLSSDEKISLFSYTVGSGHINDIMRGNDYRKYNCESIADIDNIITALQKFTLPDTVTLTRGITADGFIALFNLPSEMRDYLYDPFSFDVSKLKGLVAREPAFSSCGCTASAAFDWSEESDGVTLHIICPKGTHGAYLEPFSYYGANSKGGGNFMNGVNWDKREDGKSYAPVVGYEQEFLLQSGTIFSINDIEVRNGVLEVTLVVLRQEPISMKSVLDSYIKGTI